LLVRNEQMTAARAVLFAASLGLLLLGCRFDTRGLPVGDGARDAPAQAELGRETAAADAIGEAPIPERQAQEQSCLDGLDNDGDGAIDCADPDCLAAGYECVPTAPSAMTGYFRIRTGVFGEDPLPCADGSNAGVHGVGPLPTSCTPCTCGPLTGAACGYPTLTRWEGAENCVDGTKTDLTSTYGVSGCTKGTGSAGKNGIELSPATPTSLGSCAPSGGEVQVSKPWAEQLEVCTEGGVGGGCGNGVCVRKPASGYDATICYKLGGGGDCGSWTAVVGHVDWKDERTCTPCSCQVAGLTCTGGSYTFYGNNQTCDSGCNEPLVVNTFAKCYPLSPGDSTPFSVKATKATPAGGSCTPAGGIASGTIQSTQVTFCCY